MQDQVNTVGHFVQFILAQNPRIVIDHFSWDSCAVGQYARSNEVYYDPLLDELRENATDLYILVNHGNKFGAENSENYDIRCFSHLGESLAEDSDTARRLFKDAKPKPETCIRTYGDFQRCLKTLFPELVKLATA